MFKTALGFRHDQLNREYQSGRGLNIARILKAALCGCVSCLTCLRCCCASPAHSGTVPYAGAEFVACEPHVREAILYHEHVDVLFDCASCICCLCCLGGCGSAGPVSTSAMIQCAVASNRVTQE